MAASLAIRRLSARTPARAEAVAARLALQALGADLEDALPRSLPPQALLWLRRLQLQAPEAALLRPAPVAWRQDWIAAGRERLDAALARAARPALGPVPEDAEAVLFADAAEMLACLALAARAGQLDRWWWRGLLGRAWPQWQTAWAARPQARAAAQRLLRRAGQGGAACFDVEPANDVVELTAVAVVSTAMTTQLAPAASAVGEASAAEGLPPELGRLAVDGQAAARTRRAAVVVDDGVAVAPPAETVTLLPQVTSPATVEPLPSRPALRAEAGPPAQPSPGVRPWHAASGPRVANQAVSSARQVVRIDAPSPSGEARRTRPVAPSVGPVVAPVADRRLDAIPPLQTPLQQPVAAPAEVLPAPERSAPAAASSEASTVGAPGEATQPQTPLTPPAALSRQHVEPGAADVAWPWPQALLSRQAPLLFIVNALLEDGLYPDFTRPRDPGLPVPLWALLAALAQAWWLPGDPLHAALAERGGDWVAPACMPDAPGASAGPWAQWLPAYARSLRRRLCRRLGLRAAQWPRALTLAHPARLWLSEAEWVAEFDLAGHDVTWRLAGLDRDPGWLPSTGCSLRFQFL